MTSQNIKDVEDLLDNFIIRKPKDQTTTTYGGPRKETKSGQKIEEHIPLLVRDLLQSSLVQEDNQVFKLQNPATLYYRSCLVYGYVVGRGTSNKSYHKYIIDDGTGRVEISINVKPKESAAILSLYNEAKSLVAVPGSEIQKKVSISMIQLLTKAMEYIDGSAILPGSNIILFGRPNSFRNNIGLDVVSFSVDNDESRKLEIAFADNLIDYYRSHKNNC